MPNNVEEFNAYRVKMNDKLLAENNKVIKRIFNLDTNAFNSSDWGINAYLTFIGEITDISIVNFESGIVSLCRESILATGTASIEDQTGNLGSLRVFPNPTTGYLTLTSEELISEIMVYDLSGALVQNSRPNDNIANINLENFDPGMYVLHVFYQNGTNEISKIMKQ